MTVDVHIAQHAKATADHFTCLLLLDMCGIISNRLQNIGREKYVPSCVPKVV